MVTTGLTICKFSVPISIELDGSVILELADRLISDPGVHIEIGG